MCVVCVCVGGWVRGCVGACVGGCVGARVPGDAEGLAKLLI